LPPGAPAAQVALFFGLVVVVVVVVGSALKFITTYDGVFFFYMLYLVH
jgi:hypothetical protein